MRKLSLYRTAFLSEAYDRARERGIRQIVQAVKVIEGVGDER